MKLEQLGVRHHRHNMVRGVFTSLSLLALFSPLSSALYEQDWTIHGVWSSSRSFQKNTHISCTLPTSVPIDNFAVTINSTFPLPRFETWSLELYSKNNDWTVYTFQNLRRMYPPRIVLNFHLTSIGFIDPSGTCSFSLLNERLIATTTTTTTTTAPFIPDNLFPFPGPFIPGLIIPDALIPPTTPSLLPDFEMDPCMESSLVFPDIRQQFEGDEPLPYDSLSTTKAPTTTFRPIQLRPLQRPGNLMPRNKRFILRPDPERVNPSTNDNSEPAPVKPPEMLAINYTKAIELSMMFFAAQRSGNFEEVPQTKPYQWMRPSGTFHSAPNGRDLTGGWYNGNDNVKLTFPMAAATTVLAWGYNTWKDVYISSGLDETFKETIKWPLDYFLKSWDSSTQTLYVHVGDLGKDRTLWNRADDFIYNTLWNNNRWPVYSVSPSDPGSDVAAEVATAMALSSLIQFDDEPYSSRLLDTAKELFWFARNYTRQYSDSVPVAFNGYPDYSSGGYFDEVCLAAAVLHNITGSDTFLHEAISTFKFSKGTITPHSFSWTDKRVACAVMLYQITKDDQYVTYLQDFREQWMSPTGKHTPNGFAWRSDKGTLRYTANTIFILLTAVEAGIFEPDVAQEIYVWGAKQMEYMLGLNSMKRSYLIGYGDNYAKNAYHKNSACMHPAKPCGWDFYNSEFENQNELTGALVGGPDLNDFHDDSRQNTLGNSVAVDYNAGFQSALAGLMSRKESLPKACADYLNDVTEGSWTSESTSSTMSFAPTIMIDPTMSESTTVPGTTPTTLYTTPQPTPVPEKPEVFDYADALRKSILFYAAQRSGQEPENNPVQWRQWDNLDSENSGGWFDDGSAVKTTKVMASAVTIIGWGALKFKAGYEMAGALDDLYDNLRWPLDYFIKIWQPDAESLMQKVGLEAYERAHWSRPLESSSVTLSFVRQINVDEVAGGGEGAEIAADVATALAIGSVLFKDIDIEYSQRLLTTAKQVYRFANRLNKTFKDASSVYYSDPGEDFGDELCVAAWWMYKASQDNTYYNDGMTYMSRNGTNFALDWKNKDALCHMLVYEHTGSFKTSFLIQQGLRFWTEQTKYTPQGLAWHDYESLKFAANAAFLQALAASYGILMTPIDFHKTQVDYMLGKNNQAFSYQIGYGDRYPRRPHHRASSCPDYMLTCDWSIYNAPWKNPHELIGALVSGPGMNDVYEDVRSNYTMNRVSVEHNAGFQSVLAYLVEQNPVTSTDSSSSSSTTTTKATTQQVTATTTRQTTTTTTKQTVNKDTTTKGQTPVPATKAPAKPKTTKSNVQPTYTTKGAGKDMVRPTESNPADQNSTEEDGDISASTCICATRNSVLFFTFIQLLWFVSFS